MSPPTRCLTRGVAPKEGFREINFMMEYKGTDQFWLGKWLSSRNFVSGRRSTCERDGRRQRDIWIKALALTQCSLSFSPCFKLEAKIGSGLHVSHGNALYQGLTQLGLRGSAIPVGRSLLLSPCRPPFSRSLFSTLPPHIAS